MFSPSGTRNVFLLSIVAALGGFLFGYDTAVISGTISMVTQQYELTAVTQGWYVSSALVGSIMGVLIAGWAADRIGRKKAMLISASMFLVSALGCAVASGIDWLIIYRILGGVGIGMVSIISPMYISEIAISKIRGSLVSLYQLAITLGFLGAYLVNYQLLDLSTTWQTSNLLLENIFIDEVWRAMLGLEALPSLLFMLILLVIPESPRWLVLRGQESNASRILNRIYGSLEVAREQIHQMKQTASSVTGEAKWSELLKRPYVKIVAIGAAIAILGQFMGVNAVLYYGPTIFESSGLSGDNALFYQVMIGGVNAATTVLALLIIDRVGRKTLVYFGVSGMMITLLLIAWYFYQGAEAGISSTYLLAFFLAYIFFTAGSISAVIFVFLSELFPTRIRGKAMSIAGFSLWIGTFLIGQLTPWLLENLSPQGTFILFAVMCIPYMYIVARFLPETAGKSLEEIEEYWMADTSLPIEENTPVENRIN